ncbi:MAG: ribosome silencing factor [Spirochaetia bacterium]|jgi:ribosome-associated protein|nr:ribosome silencing factor [Spirochaetia bacterium]
MVDIVKSNEHIAVLVGGFINDHNGEDVLVIDVKDQNSWTDYMIIATVSSMGHLRGLVKQLKEVLSDNSIDILIRHKQISDDGWELIDCGSYVIHLMNTEMREFYNLEKLWVSGNIVFQSSKSS